MILMSSILQNAEAVPSLQTRPLSANVGRVNSFSKSIRGLLTAIGLFGVAFAGLKCNMDDNRVSQNIRRDNADVRNHIQSIWDRLPNEKDKIILLYNLRIIESMIIDFTPEQLADMGITKENLRKHYMAAREGLIERASMSAMDPAWSTFITTYLDGAEDAGRRAGWPDCQEKEWNAQRKVLTLNAIHAFAQTDRVSDDFQKKVPHPLTPLQGTDDQQEQALAKIRQRIQDLESKSEISEQDLLDLWRAIGPVPRRINILNGPNVVPALSGIGLPPERVRKLLAKLAVAGTVEASAQQEGTLAEGK